jgi:Lipocalin-like domain
MPTTTNSVVGTWKISNVYVKEGSNPEVDQFPLAVALMLCFKDITFVFDDKNITSKIPTGCQITTDATWVDSGTYTISCNKITVTDSKGVKTISDITFDSSTKLLHLLKQPVV